MERRGNWISTYAGRQFWPLDPRPEEIFLDDIAHSLSMQTRFTGHMIAFYSIAEHSKRCSNVAAGLMVQMGHCNTVPYWEAILWALLHDASEAYLCDVARPVKHLPEMAAYRDAEKAIELAIAVRFKLPVTMPAVVKEADEIMLVTEARDLMRAFDEKWSHWKLRGRALPEKIRPQSHDFVFTEHSFITLVETAQRALDRERANAESAKAVGPPVLTV